VKEMVVEPYGGSRFLCIPPYQRQGFATLLVRLARELKLGEDTTAFLYYSKFWKMILVSRAAYQFRHCANPINYINALSKATGIPQEEIQQTLTDISQVEREKPVYQYTSSRYLPRDRLQIQTGIELCDTENVNPENKQCPQFDAAEVIWPERRVKVIWPERRVKVFAFLFLSFFFGSVIMIPRFL
ncbi:hypothetical protein MKW94_022604, partial [Papaver nudicaule]|nr:hypothetical protein [Papaver nudicaule]